MIREYSSLEQFTKPSAGCVATVGNFDGVHLGHQAIISQAKTLAGRKSLPLVGMTFDAAALSSLFPEKGARVLTPIAIKTRLLNQAGLDHVLVVPATQHLFSMTAEEFVRDILVERLGVRHIVEGPTFNFGRRREGNMTTLRHLSGEYHFSVHEAISRTLAVSELSASGTGDVAMSSTLIRELIAGGQFAAARRCLGRWYEIYGQVVHGLGIGRQLGFPTANLRLFHANQLTPGDGVYAGWVRLGDHFDDAWHNQRYLAAAISIGRSETFGDSPWQVEAHLLDYPADGGELYDKHVFLAPVERIRPLKKFESQEQLCLAIADDCRTIKAVLSQADRSPNPS